MDPKSQPQLSREGSPSPGGADQLPREREAAHKAEIASAAAVLQNLVKAVRGFSIYLPNNPLHEKFFEDFRQRLDEHLEQFGDLQLEFAHDGVRCGGELVHTHEDRRENLGFRMHADGLRTLTLTEGIEVREARVLTEVIQLSTSEASEDDIVTGLWAGDLPHVRYVLAEAPVPPGQALLPGGGSRQVQDVAIRRCASALAAAPPPQPSAVHQLLPQHIFALEERELAALQALIDAERRRSPIEDVSGVLEAVLSADEEPAVLEELLGVVARLCGDLVVTGRLDHAARLIGVFSRVAARPGLAPERAASLAAARSLVITPEVLAGLTRLLGSGEGVPREDLRALVTALGNAAVGPFCRLLGDVTAKETRKALIEALAETGSGAPDRFLPFLADPRWYLVRNTITILRRIANPEAAVAVRRCAGHRDPRVRKEALRYLDETGDPGAEPTLLALLVDPEPTVRVAATKSLARRGSRAAAEQLFALAASSAFDEREPSEREAVWEALGDLAPARAFAELKRMLLKHYWLGAGKEVQETACAVAGLRRIGTPEALEVLRQAAATKRGAPRDVVEKALRTLALARGAGGPGPRGTDDEAPRRA